MFNILAALGFRDKYVPYPFGAGEPIIADIRARLDQQMITLTPNYTHEEQFVMNKATDHSQNMIEDMTKREIQLEQRRAILHEVIEKASKELEDVNHALKVTLDALNALNGGLVKVDEEVKREIKAEGSGNTIRNSTASNSPY